MYYFDFHIHSKYSFDSILSPEKIIKTSIKRKLNGVCVCDHGTIKGGLYSKKNEPDDFIVIIGSEVHTEYGDIIGLFLSSEITSNNFNVVADDIESQDGIIVLPHPFRNKLDTNKIPIDIINRIKIIEGYNSRTNNAGNQKAQELALNYHKPMVGGSDAHFSEEIGLSKTIFKDISEEDEIRKLLIKGHTTICGSQTPAYYKGLSKIIGNIKEHKWKNLATNCIRMPIKYLKT